MPRDWAHSGEPATDEWGLLPGADGEHAPPGDACARGGETLTSTLRQAGEENGALAPDTWLDPLRSSARRHITPCNEQRTKRVCTRRGVLSYFWVLRTVVETHPFSTRSEVGGGLGRLLWALARPRGRGDAHLRRVTRTQPCEPRRKEEVDS